MRWILAILFAAFSCQGAVYTKPTSANGLALNAPKWLVKGVALSPSAVVVASGGSGTTLLLDGSGLGSAAVAYSVRKLRSAYSGSALRVRRSSDSTEQDIGFSGNDLDAASLASFCSGTDGFVVRWYDQSGNARNATQATASKQPKIVSSGSVITSSSFPALLCSGGQAMIATNVALTATSVIGVFRQPSATSAGILMEHGANAANSDGFYIYQATSASHTFSRSGTLTAKQQPSATWQVNATSVLFEFYYNGTDVSHVSYRNNSSVSLTTFASFNGNPGTSSLTSTLNLFSRNNSTVYANLYVSELVVWSSDVSASRGAAASNVNDYFSLY